MRGVFYFRKDEMPMAYEQIVLFAPDKKPAEPPPEEYDGQPALVYLSTEHGAGRLLWKCTVRDAKKICSLPGTSGKYLGNEWAYFWTTLKNYVGAGGSLAKYQKKHYQKDDGRFAEIFKANGIKAEPI
jgi:hypothetical protein